jgi:hypothetical protein
LIGSFLDFDQPELKVAVVTEICEGELKAIPVVKVELVAVNLFNEKAILKTALGFEFVLNQVEIRR